MTMVIKRGRKRKVPEVSKRVCQSENEENSPQFPTLYDFNPVHKHKDSSQTKRANLRVFEDRATQSSPVYLDSFSLTPAAESMNGPLTDIPMLEEPSQSQSQYQYQSHEHKFHHHHHHQQQQQGHHDHQERDSEYDALQQPPLSGMQETQKQKQLGTSPQLPEDEQIEPLDIEADCTESESESELVLPSIDDIAIESSRVTRIIHDPVDAEPARIKPATTENNNNSKKQLSSTENSSRVPLANITNAQGTNSSTKVASDLAKAPSSETSGEERSAKGTDKLKTQLLNAVKRGSLPHFCQNCGEIETKAWRRIPYDEAVAAEAAAKAQGKPYSEVPAPCVDLRSRNQEKFIRLCNRKFLFYFILFYLLFYFIFIFSKHAGVLMTWNIYN